MKEIQTPYYLIDEHRLRQNMDILSEIKESSGAKMLLALKCFATWGVFDIMKPYMDGTTSSSYYEARLGYETFGKETHAYSVAFSKEDVQKVSLFTDKIIFNSLSQLDRYYNSCSSLICGIRINPGISYSDFDLADPAREFSRLGVKTSDEIEAAMDRITGAMFHFNCENKDVAAFEKLLQEVSEKYGSYLQQFEWISLGGGLSYTEESFERERFIRIIRGFSEKFNLQIYLEPGEAAIAHTTTLVTTILDIVENNKKIAIVDASIEPHMLDLLIYREQAAFENSSKTGKDNFYQIAGKSCLAGDIFGEAYFLNDLQPGDKILVKDAAGYTMVKKNWFNGIKMPAIAVRRENGQVEVIQKFSYKHYKENLTNMNYGPYSAF